MVERLTPGLTTAATLFGAAFTILGQAVFDPFAGAAERLVGGSMILAAAYFIARATLRLFRESRLAAEEDRKAALAREELLVKQISQLTSQLSETNAQLAKERQLRLSLEQMGLSDRRTQEEA